MTIITAPEIHVRTEEGWLDTATGELIGVDSPPGLSMFPTATSVGVPSGWEPLSTHNGLYQVTTDGAVIEDLRVVGSIRVRANNVTLRRVEVVNGRIYNNYAGVVYGGLLIEDCSIVRDEAGQEYAFGIAAIGEASYTARRVMIDGADEGFRIGQVSNGGGPVTIEDCYCRIVGPDEGDWHGDGIQVFQGNSITVNNSTIFCDPSPAGNGTSAFFDPDNVSNVGTATINRMLCRGGSITFRLEMPGTVNKLYVVEDSYTFAPVSLDNEETITEWDARLCTLDGNGQPIPGAVIPLASP